MTTHYIFYRNATTDLVEQELLFVGAERGKLVALRNIIQKVLSLLLYYEIYFIILLCLYFIILYYYYIILHSIKGILPPVLVFVQSKERAQELFNELIYDGINVDVIHADRTQTQVFLL